MSTGHRFGRRPAPAKKRQIKFSCAWCSDGDATREGGTCGPECAASLKALSSSAARRGRAPDRPPGFLVGKGKLK